ncbi:MAG: ABC transporter substrate-binding protein [Crocinitomicaceae bacterium]|nr:ABC transporter substrate-binding protein [Flavobacteriales bacterium]NQZ34216.1 ABC transporter substrate-binding protein [Crocinitomicaceae bacterium]
MKLILFLLTIVLLVNSCQENQPSSIDLSNKKDLTSKINETPTEVKVEFAENFHVRAVKGGYELELLDPNSHEVESTYTLTFDHSKKGDKVIHLPVEHIAALSQTSVGMLSKLNALETITGISKIDYVYSPEIKKRFKAGEISEFGDETSAPIEKIVKSNTKLIIYSGFGSEFDGKGKLKKLGIQSIPNYEWRETHPLGRAEWIKFLGILIDKPTEANAIFEEIKSNYEDLRWKTRDLDDFPKVISGNFYSDQWTAPAGNSYMAILFQDAGAEYMYKSSNGTGSVFLPIEKVVFENRKTDYWLNPGVSSKAILSEMNPKAQFIGAYDHGIYCYSHEMNKFWEMSAIEPDFLLADFIHIFHPDFEPNSELHFYKVLSK